MTATSPIYGRECMKDSGMKNEVREYAQILYDNMYEMRLDSACYDLFRKHRPWIIRPGENPPNENWFEALSGYLDERRAEYWRNAVETAERMLGKPMSDYQI